MRTTTLLACVLAAALPSVARAADATARIGEVRSFVIDVSTEEQADGLRHDGWLEADGRVVTVSSFPELFKAVGRTWTGRRVAADRFALPVLGAARRHADNPFGVLGPGDLVTSGSRPSPRNVESTWIFAGRDVADALQRSGALAR